MDSVWFEHTQHGEHDAAILRLNSLADRGNPLAMRALGTTYMSGIGVGPDEERAAEWFRRAAAHGDVRAQELITAYDSTQKERR